MRPASVLAALSALVPLIGASGCVASRETIPPAVVGAPATATTSPAPSPPPSGDRPSTVPFDISTHSTTNPRSIWVIVNKAHQISPTTFRPDISLVRGYQLASVAAGPLTRLLNASDREALGFKIASAYRSYGYQQRVHDDIVASRGTAEAAKISARAGHSEHQTGLAVDLITPDDPTCNFELCFARTPGGRWLAEHSWEFGFIIRYTPGNERITGYEPEPWHLRYVGKPLAAAMRSSGTATLEEFLQVSGGDYR